ncbi:MAG: FAD:protein FMN transferase [Clostridia bacterium]|nr:FAD:protein FMN transferase [Clostridia bacterium]
MKKYIILAVIIALIIGASVISGTLETSKTQFVLNTVSTIKIKGNNTEAVNKAFTRISQIESRMSSHISTSDISTGTLNSDTSYVISKGLDYGDVSEGKFDITVRPLCDLWDINGNNPRIPSQEEIDALLPLVNYQKVSLYNDNLVMEEGMALELGAIAKGYAADEACRILREEGVKDGFVDLGGNVVAIGIKTVGIRNPLSENNGDYFGTIKLTDCAVATSGGYERYFEQDGKKYHHIFDPKTGYPVETDILSDSVI